MPLSETETRYLAGWNQDFVPWPEEIVTDDATALMTERAFQKLPEYSCSLPSAAYPGKRWRAQLRTGEWFYREFHEVENPERVGIKNLRIILV